MPHVKPVAWFAAAIAIGVCQSANAAEKMDVSFDCPLGAQLRVAGAASVSDFQSLANCPADRITISPASPGEIDSRATTVIAPPEAERPIARNLTLASAESGAAAATDDGDESILALRPVSYSTIHDRTITDAAVRNRIDPLLLHAVIKTESAYRSNAVSSAGARGLMQLMPATARMLGVPAIGDPVHNVDGGARLLRRLYGRYGDFRLTLAAYNAGEGAVARYGNTIPPFAETQAYVRKVLSTYDQLLAEQQRNGQ